MKAEPVLIFVCVCLIVSPIIAGIRNGVHEPCHFCGCAVRGSPWTKDRFEGNKIDRPMPKEAPWQRK